MLKIPLPHQSKDVWDLKKGTLGEPIVFKTQTLWWRDSRQCADWGVRWMPWVGARFPLGNEGCVIPPAEVLFRRALCSSSFQGLPQLKSNTSSKVTPPSLGSLPPITDEQRLCRPSLLVETTSDTSWEDHPVFRTPPKAGWGFCWDYITAQFPPLFNPASFPSPISTDPKGSP